MQVTRTINAVDSHTMGEPTRIVTGGIPSIPGKTMPERKAYLEKNLDHLRTGIMLEPRGHNDMFGSIITPPISEEADLGIIFMDGGGYLNMCGHGTIGAMTVALETGMVPMVEPVTNVVLEAPAGLVRGTVAVKNGKVQEVSFKNVPSFL
ncbi:MAG: proline racemase, partial [Clostridiales bacterium]